MSHKIHSMKDDEQSDEATQQDEVTDGVTFPSCLLASNNNNNGLSSFQNEVSSQVFPSVSARGKRRVERENKMKAKGTETF